MGVEGALRLASGDIALQVGDRWHVLRGLGEVPERLLDGDRQGLHHIHSDSLRIRTRRRSTPEERREHPNLLTNFSPPWDIMRVEEIAHRLVLIGCQGYGRVDLNTLKRCFLRAA